MGGRRTNWLVNETKSSVLDSKNWICNSTPSSPLNGSDHCAVFVDFRDEITDANGVTIKLQDVLGVQATLGWQLSSGTNILANRCCWRIFSRSKPAIVKFRSSFRTFVNFRIYSSEIRGRVLMIQQYWEEGVEDRR